MAYASKSTLRTARPVEYDETPLITLELNADEAQVLADIFGRIGGHPEKTRRGLTDSIAKALGAAGVSRRFGGPDDISREERAIRFLPSLI